MRRRRPLYPIQVGLVVMALLCAGLTAYLVFTPVSDDACGTLAVPRHRAQYCGRARSERITVIVGLGVATVLFGAVGASARRR